MVKLLRDSPSCLRCRMGRNHPKGRREATSPDETTESALEGECPLDCVSDWGRRQPGGVEQIFPVSTRQSSTPSPQPSLKAHLFPIKIPILNIRYSYFVLINYLWTCRGPTFLFAPTVPFMQYRRSALGLCTSPIIKWHFSHLVKSPILPILI